MVGAVLLSLLLPACGVNALLDTGAEPCVDCALADDNNFSYAADLTADVVPIGANADATLDWSALAHDLQGHALDPAVDIGQVQLVAMRDLAPDEVATALANDDLEQSAVTLYVTCDPEGAACALSEFGVLGAPFDLLQYLDDGVATWLVALTRFDEPGAATLVFLEPRDGEANHTVAVGDDTSRLDVDVDLAALAPVVVPEGEPAVTLDWSGLTRDGLGNPLDLGRIDDVLLARFDQPVEELQTRVFDLEEIASASWRGDVSGGRSVSLDTLEGDTPFAGVDDEGTWLVALGCSTCSNPAPRFVTRLSPGR
jgi:hypothetical protein